MSNEEKLTEWQKMSPEQRQKQIDYVREWRERNREHYRKKQREYYRKKSKEIQEKNLEAKKRRTKKQIEARRLYMREYMRQYRMDKDNAARHRESMKRREQRLRGEEVAYLERGRPILQD